MKTEIPVTVETTQLKSTLRDIVANAVALDEILYEMDGEITPETEATIDLWLRESKQALEAKVDTYCALINTQRTLAQARATEAARLQGLSKTADALANKLAERLQFYLSELGKTSLETVFHKVSVVKNGGRQKLIVPSDWERYPESAPERYHKHVIELNEARIRDDLQLLASLEALRATMAAAEDKRDPCFDENWQQVVDDIEALKDVRACSLAERGTHLRIK